MSVHKYLSDKLTIFFNLVMVLLGIFNVLLVLLRVDTTQTAAIIGYNTTKGIAGFERASTTQLYQFALIPLVIIASQTFIAWRVHSIKRGLSMLVLGLGIVAVAFAIVVSSAILNLHR